MQKEKMSNKLSTSEKTTRVTEVLESSNWKRFQQRIPTKQIIELRLNRWSYLSFMESMFLQFIRDVLDLPINGAHELCLGGDRALKTAGTLIIVI